MELSTLLIIIIIALILVSIGFMIPDVKYKIAYFMVICLLGLSILNIYLSVVYYIQLRNDPGLPGQQGQKGPKGAKGAPGVCSYAKECGIKDGRKIILDIVEQMYPDIPRECIDTPSLSKCKNEQNLLEEAMPINNQIGMLEKIAYSTTMSETDFKAKLNVCLQDSKQCLDPTDF